MERIELRFHHVGFSSAMYLVLCSSPSMASLDNKESNSYAEKLLRRDELQTIDEISERISGALEMGGATWAARDTSPGTTCHA
ncbi:hypothetical protein CEXT_10831 [Caerostris extrusa]|uniref:Uncharacterized protein n=1 Tax=Caerostris extrusa TaxID=172846 RepID=A0AAV4NQZ7_CAEEX|nr:hypothetical protein CEXT_10831 [Caerostris extrusa]